jgi:hypothetical protein
MIYLRDASLVLCGGLFSFALDRVVPQTGGLPPWALFLGSGICLATAIAATRTRSRAG